MSYRAYNWVLQQQWGSTPELLNMVASIAHRETDQTIGIIEANIVKQLGLNGGELALLSGPTTSLKSSSGVIAAPGVAVIPIDGPILRFGGMFGDSSGSTSINQINRAYDAAMSEDSIHTVIYDISSGGGAVEGVNEYVNKMYANRGKKRVIAYCSGTCASAAYWIASACDAIYCDAISMIGSIGVIGPMPVKDGYEIISSQSPYKRLDPNKPEHMKRAQARINETADVMIASIARNRGINKKKVLKAYGQGDVFIGVDAVNAGMVEGIASLDGLVQHFVQVQAAFSDAEESIAASGVFCNNLNQSPVFQGGVQTTMSILDTVFGRKVTKGEAAQIQAEAAQIVNGQMPVMPLNPFTGFNPAQPDPAALLGGQVANLFVPQQQFAQPATAQYVQGVGQLTNGQQFGQVGNVGVVSNTLSAGDAAELQRLKAAEAFNAQNAQRQAANTAATTGATIAPKLLTEGKIEAHLEPVFASAFAKLAMIGSMEGMQDFATVQFNTFNTQAQAVVGVTSLVGLFEAALGAKPALQVGAELIQQPANVTALFNKPTTGGTATGANTNMDARIANMALGLGGKPADVQAALVRN